MRAEPIRERIDFTQRAQSSHGNSFHGKLLTLVQNKEMTLRRRDASCHLEKVDCLWQAQFRQAVEFKPADAEQKARCNSLYYKLDRDNITGLKTSMNKDGIS